MKYWRGYLVAAIVGACSWGLIEFAQTHWTLVDMIYPYMTRMIQDYLITWNSGAEFCLWQLALIVLGVILHLVPLFCQAIPFGIGIAGYIILLSSELQTRNLDQQDKDNMAFIKEPRNRLHQ